MRGRGRRATLRATSRPTWRSSPPKRRSATREFPGIIENVKLLSAQLQSAEGTLGRVRSRQRQSGACGAFARAAERLMAHVSGIRHGSLGMALGSASERSVELGSRTCTARWRRSIPFARWCLPNSTRSGDFAATRRSFGEIARDCAPSLATCDDSPASPTGGIGRTCESTRRSCGRFSADLRDAIDSLRADMKKHPLRYIAF